MALIRYAGVCRAADGCGAGGTRQQLPDSFLRLLEGALTRDATSELLEAAMATLMECAGEAPSLVEGR